MREGIDCKIHGIKLEIARSESESESYWKRGTFNQNRKEVQFSKNETATWNKAVIHQNCFRKWPKRAELGKASKNQDK